MAVTKPELAFTVATDVLELLHVPPAVPLLVYVAVDPTQSGEVPLTVPALTLEETVKGLTDDIGLPHPLLIVYVMFVVPAFTAVTKPLLTFTVATEVLELLHVPPAVPLLVYVAVAPTQSGEVPLTVPPFTFEFTVRVFEALRGLPLQSITV